MNVDDGPEDIRWIRVLGGEKLSASSYSLLNLQEGIFFVIGEGSAFFSRLFSTQQLPSVSIRRLAGARRVSPAVL